MTTPENPFFNRGPIFDPTHFFGREREQRRITGLLKNMQNVSVVGHPKRGKTSLLLHLARPETQRAHGLDPETHIFTFLDMEGVSDLTPDRFFHWVLRETGRQGQRRPILADLPRRDADGSVSFTDLRDALDRLGAAGARLVYLIDEFDLAATNEHFDLNFFSALRAVASTPHVAFVTATESLLYDLIPTDRQAGSPLANLFTTIYLGPMPEDEAARLVTELGRTGDADVAPYLDFVFKMCGGFPYCTQVLCSLLWERGTGSGPPREADLEYAREEFYHEHQPFMAMSWGKLSEPHRAALIALVSGGAPADAHRSALADLKAHGLIVERGGSLALADAILERFVRERAAEERANADAFLAVDQADQRATDQVALPSDKRSIYSVVRALVKATEARNPYIRGHSDSTTRYAVAITQEMDLPPEEIEGIKVAARLHDIGHIGVSDLVLLKPGPLTPNETEIVHAHVLVSVHILEALDFPWVVKPAVRSHHERWDGSGYPDGLMGEEIPLGARILAVADVAAAMTAERPWRPALPLAEAVAELKAHAGTKYDPQVIHAFLRVIERLPPGASAPARQGRRGARAHGDET
jgi:HD-GYP domain-containing protein (c-di-GMP phosphodiesterase class II)